MSGGVIQRALGGPSLVWRSGRSSGWHVLSRWRKDWPRPRRWAVQGCGEGASWPVAGSQKGTQPGARQPQDLPQAGNSWRGTGKPPWCWSQGLFPVLMAGVQSQHWAQDREGAGTPFRPPPTAFSLPAPSEPSPGQLNTKEHEQLFPASIKSLM